MATAARFIQTVQAIDPSIDFEILSRMAVDLQTRYAESQRHYHTLDHLSHMFSSLDSHLEGRAPLLMVELAIWFHDCVYDPERGSPWNEQESIRVWEAFVDSTGSTQLMNLKQPVSALIEGTIVHSIPQTLPEGLPTETFALFMDLDMAILAESAEVYDKYAAEIRQEFIHFPAEAYNQGRTEILESFLQKKQIYLGNNTQHLETLARENVQRELARLKSS